MSVGDFVVITESLSAEDTIVTDGLQRARPGAKVVPERVELAMKESEIETVSSDSINPPAPAGGGELENPQKDEPAEKKTESDENAGSDSEPGEIQEGEQESEDSASKS